MEYILLVGFIIGDEERLMVNDRGYCADGGARHGTPKRFSEHHLFHDLSIVCRPRHIGWWEALPDN